MSDPLAAKAEDTQFSTIMLMLAEFTPAELTEVLSAAVAVKSRRQKVAA